jgi:hypothetical protein
MVSQGQQGHRAASHLLDRKIVRRRCGPIIREMGMDRMKQRRMLVQVIYIGCQFPPLHIV